MNSTSATARRHVIDYLLRRRDPRGDAMDQASGQALAVSATTPDPGAAAGGAQRGVATHYTRYALGNLLALAAGFVSFPILTRTLSNYQFGLIGYLDAILLLAVAVLKYGLGDAVLRFYPHNAGQAEIRRFVASLLLVPMAVSAGVWLLATTAVAAAVSTGAIQHGRAVMLALATLPFTTFASYVQWLMAAQEYSAVNAATNTASKWLQTLLVVALVLLLVPSVSSVYLGRLLALVAISIWLGSWLWRHVRPRFGDADLALTRKAAVYGLPLALSEITAIAYIFVDRMMLKAILGDFTAVGIYTIGSALAAYVSMLVGSSLVQAYAPVINRIYTRHGAAAVVGFKQRIVLPMTYVAALLVAGLLLVGHDFFELIAGAEKMASAPVFILLSVTYVAFSMMGVCGYGAMLVGRTRRLLAVRVAGIALHAALNLVLIPAHGVMGAVYAVMATEPLVELAIYLTTCPPSLRCLPTGRALVQAAGLAAIAATAGWLVLQTIPPEAPLLRLAGAGTTLVLCYGLPLALIEPRFRRFAGGLIKRALTPA